MGGIGRRGRQNVYALRDGKRHTRSHPSLLALAEYLGRVERPVRFVEDSEALDAVIEKHARETQHFVVRREACRVAVFNRYKYRPARQRSWRSSCDV